MACSFPEHGSHRTGTAGDGPPNTALRTLLVEALFQQLPGSWTLTRQLQSTNSFEPAGKCAGTAVFRSREPSIWINTDGKLEMASAELVYHEQGHFEMQQNPAQVDGIRFPFSRKYVWRLQKQDEKFPTISIWFTKPGTETIDYLFHKVQISLSEPNEHSAPPVICLDGDGCHLCEEDIYSSAYTFEFRSESKQAEQDLESMELKQWTMLHEVRGPQKDQVIETTFTKE